MAEYEPAEYRFSIPDMWSRSLREYLAEVTDRVVSQVIHDDLAITVVYR